MSDRHSQAALSAIIDIAADGVIALDERFRIVRYNQGAERIFQWSEDEMLGGAARDRCAEPGAHP